jgi:protein associated with RNAse G/E
MMGSCDHFQVTEKNNKLSAICTDIYMPTICFWKQWFHLQIYIKRQILYFRCNQMSSLFGSELHSQCEIRTINSLAFLVMQVLRVSDVFLIM